MLRIAGDEVGLGALLEDSSYSCNARGVCFVGDCLICACKSYIVLCPFCVLSLVGLCLSMP